MSFTTEQNQPRKRRKAPPPPPPPPIRPTYRAPQQHPPQNFGTVVTLLNEAVKPFIGERPALYDPNRDQHELYRDPRERESLPLHVDQDQEARHGINETVYAIRVQLWEMHRTLFMMFAVIVFFAAKSGLDFSDLGSFLAL